MKKRTLLLGMLLLEASLASGQTKLAYRIFDGRGRQVSYEKMLKVLSKQDIVLFGEYHNNPIAHWLQLELVKDLYALRPLTLGAEMFETDNQQVLDRYLQGALDERGLDSLARLWPNYKTDYAPLVKFARANGIPFVATNIPRKYAAAVARSGFEALYDLPEKEKALMAPLPIPFDPELPGYKNMLTMMGDHANENFPKAQAAKDATMAHFILQSFAPGRLFLHINGAYHSDNYEGILWYLRRTRPNLRYATLSTVIQTHTGRLEAENRGRADFILCVDEDMTTTY